MRALSSGGLERRPLEVAIDSVKTLRVLALGRRLKNWNRCKNSGESVLEQFILTVCYDEGCLLQSVDFSMMMQDLLDFS